MAGSAAAAAGAADLLVAEFPQWPAAARAQGTVK